VVAGLLLLAACGDDGGAADEEAVAPADWASTVCPAVGQAAGELGRALAVIDQLPDEVEADAPLGDHARPVREAFLALPTYVDAYRTVVEDTPAPDTADGAAFRQEVLDDLDAAADTFDGAAVAAEQIDDDTTVEDFFGGAQAFAGFPEALADSDLDFGDDVPPGVAEALAADRSCIDVQNRLISLIGG
jgi:hypothetical protein